MKLEHAPCYTALSSRDARFDGRFFTGVVTTGVYCRPVCPAPTPRPENCRFFMSAAAAAQAGFRPCLRCHPECAPGTPAWSGSSAVVSRALRLVADGALDEGGVESLAGRLGIGARHLRRLFLEHLGATPVAVAQTRRIHLAKQLLDETRLPATRVAEAAGFGSLRRFNAAILSTYGRAPRELRRQAESGAAAADAVLELTLAYRPPFDWPALMEFLSARAIPGVEAAGVEAYRRSFCLDGQTGVLEIRPVPGRHSLRLGIPAGIAHQLPSITGRVRRLFDLEADPVAIASDLGRDAALAPLVAAHPGLRVPGAWDGFELAVRAILGQQITVRAATTLAGRIAREFGPVLRESSPGGPDRLFPPAAVLSDADLTTVGLTQERALTIRRLARVVCDGELRLDGSADPVELAERLRRLRGIGEWTVQYVLMRAVHEPDAFPAADLGLRWAFAPDGPPASARQVLERAEAWRPWRAYAAVLLWRGGVGCLTNGPRNDAASAE